MAIPKPGRVFEVHESGTAARRPNRGRRWLVAVLVLFAAGGLATWLVSGRVSGASQPPRSVEIRHGSLTLAVPGYGKIIPANLVSLVTPSGGRVLKIVRRAGSRVGAGEPILVLENAELVQRLQEAEKALAEENVDLLKAEADSLSAANSARSNLEDLRDSRRVAQLEVEGLRVLAAQKIVTPIELEKALVGAKSLERRIADAETAIDRLDAIRRATAAGNETVLKTLRDNVRRLRSEVDGLVVKAPAGATIFEMPGTLSVGSQLDPGATVASLALGERLGVELQIPAGRAPEVVVGQRAEVSVDGTTFPAKVLRIDPQVVRDELAVRLEIAGVTPKGVLAGQPITGRIFTRELTDVTFVPRSGKASPNRSGSLLVARHASQGFEKRTVVFGAGDADWIVIVRGARPGEVVAIEGE